MKQEINLEKLALSLTHAVYRNSVIEDFHAEEAPLTDEVMRDINKDVYNRMYTLLKLLYSSRAEDKETLNKILAFNLMFGTDWDKPEEYRLEDF